MAAVAETHGVSLRALRNWRRLVPGEETPREGRPPTSDAELAEARRRVAAELACQGWDAGEEPVWRALGGEISRARVRRVLRELKAEYRKRRRAHLEAQRVSMEVHARDAVWALDATHLGRDEEGRAVQAEVVREVASTRTLHVSVGRCASGRDVVRVLERVVRERGGAPLVLQVDNGAAYTSQALGEWCWSRGVVVLRNRPRTPQHNPTVEHGMHELKWSSGFGRGVHVDDVRRARERIVRVARGIDTRRPRCTRSWLTAVEADRAAPHWSAYTTRAGFRTKVTCALVEALLDCTSRAAERRACREAILATLEELSVITRTRGGRSRSAQCAEIIS